MVLTSIVMGPSGIGKTPLDALWRPDVRRFEPYRVRPTPRDAADRYYVSQEVRDRARQYYPGPALVTYRDIEVFHDAVFCRVRGDDQFILRPAMLAGRRGSKAEIYAPTIEVLLRLDNAQDALGFLVGGCDCKTLALILNPLSTPYRKCDQQSSKLADAVAHAVWCRALLQARASRIVRGERVDDWPTDKEKDEARQDATKRAASIKEELPAWVALLAAERDQFKAVEVTDWAHPEYTYAAPACSPDDVPTPYDKDERERVRKKKLREARKQLLAAVEAQAGKCWADLLKDQLVPPK